MTPSALHDALRHLAPLTLEELEAEAALLTRRDRKYVVPIEIAMWLIEQIGASGRVLDADGRRSFRYDSVYFDTPDRSSFLGAARRRRRRFKVRTRTYVDAGTTVLELKSCNGRGQTVKERIPTVRESTDRLDGSGRAFLASNPLVGSAVADLEPTLRTSYVRSTIVLESGARVTIDVDVRATAPDGRTAALRGCAVVECKSSGPPTRADRALWARGHRPVRISKYCTSLAALERELPANRWGRALRHPWTITSATTAASAWGICHEVRAPGRLRAGRGAGRQVPAGSYPTRS